MREILFFSRDVFLLPCHKSIAVILVTHFFISSFKTWQNLEMDTKNLNRIETAISCLNHQSFFQTDNISRLNSCIFFWTDNLSHLNGGLFFQMDNLRTEDYFFRTGNLSRSNRLLFFFEWIALAISMDENFFECITSAIRMDEDFLRVDNLSCSSRWLFFFWMDSLTHLNGWVFFWMHTCNLNHLNRWIYFSNR